MGAVVFIFTATGQLISSTSGSLLLNFTHPRRLMWLTKDVKSVVKVIEAGPRYDREGRLIGQRAVLILLDPVDNKQYAAVFWTDGRLLFAIVSSSMTHVMQFERYRAPSLVGSTK